MLTSVKRREVAVLKLRQQLGGDGCAKGPLQGRSLEGGMPARAIRAQIRTPAWLATSHVHEHVAGWGAHDTHEVTLGPLRSTGDTGTDRDVPRRCGGRGGYDATSVVTGSARTAATASPGISGAASAPAEGSGGAPLGGVWSLRISMRQPVSLAARRAF